MPQVGTQIFMVPWNHIKYILDKCGNDQSKALFSFFSRFVQLLYHVFSGFAICGV